MPTPELQAFGKAVRAARVKNGQTLAQLAGDIWGDESRKGYLSQVENGKRRLSPLTIAKIAEQLAIDGPVLDRALGLDLPAEDTPTPLDAQAGAMLDRAGDVAARLKLAESLVISLAYRFAETNPTDLEGAIAGLEQALAAAQRLAEQGSRPSNHPDFIDDVFAEVARLNAEAREDDAADAFEAALAREAEESAARQQKLLRGLADQHILRGDAAGLVAVQERLLRLDGLTGTDLYHALRDWGIERYRDGERQGVQFDLHVAAASFEACTPLAPDDERRGWSMNDLGNALQLLGMRGDDAALRDAVTTHRAALEVRTRDALPMDWAMTQNNLGNALLTLGERGDDAALRDAVTAYRAALEVRTRGALPVAWAETQNNLGTALLTLGERGDDAALRDAVTAFRAALEVHTRDALPVDWAMTQNNLGNALQTLGQRGDDAALHEAVAAYRAALEVHTRDALPVDWAMTQHNIGNALRTLGQRGHDAALRDAITAYRAALEVHTRDALPVHWAMTRETMTLCFEALAQAHPSAARAHLRDGLTAVEDALTIYTSDQMPHYFDRATRLRDRIRAALDP
ncbi:helix-turn-helix domain-containing protein [Jannaschia ovalis]|uniref:Tetratricopeptide repeat protein n=1 Tax=Jannaschia ovalis TaxID=3038773 RepID=A0ABY8LCK0_9RHOB|nr:helix-turn-helix transcriptional regulator [Jannaschia sp. GRR-S6-38]WGH78123.1 tetratricopeptide repeat protein [Jannaschia sp. GRR-S6-38]